MSTNTKIRAMIMKVSKPDEDFVYKDGKKYHKDHKWWDEDDVKSGKIPVVFNYTFAVESMVGVVTKLEVDSSGCIWADMILDLNDEDDKRVVDGSMFGAGITNTTVKDDIIIGKIDCVSTIRRKYNPYRMQGYGGWNYMGDTKESAKCAKKIKKMLPSDEAIKKG